MIKAIIPSQCLLGEGPICFGDGRSLLWVDIKKPALHTYDLCSERWQQLAMPEPLCWVLPSERLGFIAGFRQSLYQLNPISGERTLIRELDLAANIRLNDAAVVPNGSVLFGTMDDNEVAACGHLFQYDADNVVRVLDSGYTVSNGPVLSLDGTKLFSTDSAKRTIYCFDVDDDGALCNKRLFVVFSADMGYPDGMCVDCAGNLWVAAFQGGGVYCFDNNAEQINFIALPAWQVTSVAFVGEQREMLMVTSARVGLEQSHHQQFPHNGDTFLLDVGSQGPHLHHAL
ncbi:SMP-30/gluconolactonase/LRE family protein [Pseudoalteromonas pernae]|uniref:SMP-30/gluconolactonase/LRE family protein n=1 Tax=Pseudoalteromonas pernae TaxID=3118054 RepID=UPI003242E6AE